MPSSLIALCVAEETSISSAPLATSSIDDFAVILGIEIGSPPACDEAERAYLSGFLTGLRSEQARSAKGVPVLPPSAPFDRAKTLYIDGLLAGLFSRAQVTPAEVVLSPSTPEMLILWASQTGNAESIAGRCEQHRQNAANRAKLLSMESAKVSDLAEASEVLFITSTFGDSDAPDNAASLWKALSSVSPPQLSNLRYATLALGDSNYDQFCGFGRKLDARLSELGAARLMDRVDCEPNYEDRVAAWLDKVVTLLAPTAGEQPHGTPAVEQAKELATTFSRTNPLRARLIRNQLLNAPWSLKEVRQFGFNLRDSGFHYAAGDALGVWPVNCRVS